MARVGELWSVNTSQKDIMQILQREGYALTERALSKIRKDNGWTLRSTNGMKPQSCTPRKRSNEDDEAFEVPDLAPEVVAKRKVRNAILQAESDERLRNRTRRVRIQGYAGMGPDPPMEPRFPSEMTISQSKEQLGLTKETYILMRNEFQAICERQGITKKTLAGAERWQNSKDELAKRFPFLQTTLNVASGVDGGEEVLKKRRMALDIICGDVTKKIRTSRSRVTIPDAKSAMGINPAQGSMIRKQFYQILLADHFTSKIEAGPEHWNDLKRNLIANSAVLQEILVSDGSVDGERELNSKRKALEVLCRDVMKRLRDDQTKKAKNLKAVSSHSQSENNMDAHVANYSDSKLSSNNELSLGNEQSFIDPITSSNGYHPRNGFDSIASQDPPTAPTPSTMLAQAYSDHPYGIEIDPSLLRYTGGHPALTYHSQPVPASSTAWFRVSNTSPERLQPRIWMSAVPNPPTLHAIHSLALSQFANAGVQIVKIEAFTRNMNSVTIDHDDELEVFLQSAQGETPKFMFHFAPTM